MHVSPERKQLQVRWYCHGSVKDDSDATKYRPRKSLRGFLFSMGYLLQSAGINQPVSNYERK